MASSAKERFEDFVDGPIEGVVFRPITPYNDQRGWLAELYREDELPAERHPVMAYVSETRPGRYGVGRRGHRCAMIESSGPHKPAIAAKRHRA